jgi:hypothetical protein
MQHTFEAQLTGNRLDVYTLSPKALLLLPEGNQLGRTHCWVDLHLVEHIQPQGHKRPKHITFQAEIKSYLKRGTIQSNTLTNLTNIKIVKKKKCNKTSN